ARRMGLFRIVRGSGERLRGPVSNPADDAGPRDRRRPVPGRSPGTADEAGGLGREGGGPEGHRTLGARGTAPRDDRGTDDVPLTPAPATRPRTHPGVRD